MDVLWSFASAELVFEAPESEVDARVHLIRERMRQVVNQHVPLGADLGFGATGRAAKDNPV